MLGIGSASAADLPVKAPPMIAAPAFSWTGFYVGGNVGYSWGNSDTNTFFNNAEFGSFAHSDALRLNGIIGGGQVGFNWQASPAWVFGVEADWQASGEKASGSVSDPFASPASVGTVTTSYEAKISSFGTLRGRIGYAWDRLLVYGTAGLAYGQVRLTGTTNQSGIDSQGGSFNLSTPFSSSNSNIGWAVGAGIEGAIANNWTWKAEYLYIDLGSLDVSQPVLDFGGSITAHGRFTDNIVRVGFNYRFN